jgi:hypothetical protein
LAVYADDFRDFSAQAPHGPGVEAAVLVKLQAREDTFAGAERPGVSPLRRDIDGGRRFSLGPAQGAGAKFAIGVGAGDLENGDGAKPLA